MPRQSSYTCTPAYTVEGLAARIASGAVPDSLKTKRILSLNLAQLLAGTRYRGDFEERLKEVVGAVMADPDIILFIDELHLLSLNALSTSRIAPPSP